jgi:hypothetical protein
MAKTGFRKKLDIDANGKTEHQFLRYRRADIYFIYSFAWNYAKRNLDELWQELEPKGWDRLPLHERRLSCKNEKASGTYSPTLLWKDEWVLQKSDFVAHNIRILPALKGSVVLDKSHIETIADLEYCIRLFDHGAGLCSFAVTLKGEQATFPHIHYAMRLAPNVDYAQYSKAEHSTTASIRTVSKGKAKTQYSKSFRVSNARKLRNNSTLSDIFQYIMSKRSSILPDKWETLWLDTDYFATTTPGGVWQNPYLFAMLELEAESYARFRNGGDELTLKEICSILCRITLDNGKIREEFDKISLDYIHSALDFDSSEGKLRNQCLDDRLFFTMGRRAASAITPDRKNLPTSFVVPSLLNLVEILRSRWHLGNIVNVRLNEAIEKASASICASPSQILESVYLWRGLFASFLCDPVPFLFDGGSITEIADKAGEVFWLDRLRDDANRKFNTLDRLIEDLYSRKRFEQFLKSSDQWIHQKKN